jgi:DMSO reductase anchor subunit
MLTNDTTQPSYLLIGLVGLVGALGLSLFDRNQVHQTAGRLRLGLIGLAIVGVIVIIFSPVTVGRWVVVPTFIIALFAEIIGRWNFYEHLHQRVL